MPAELSSAILAALTQRTHANPLQETEAPQLLAYSPRSATCEVAVADATRRDAPAHWVVPSGATIRRTLALLDAEALAEVIGAWLADHDRPDQRRRRWAVAVDGKTLRGATRDGRAVHLLADLELAVAVVTADALHAHAEALGFPHASQVLQVTRKTRDLRSRRWRTVVVDAVTSLAHARASPARLADLLRGHWSIENGPHWVRDVTSTEDASQVRSGTAPQVMACLRNLAIGVLCRAGPVNLAAALRFHSRDPHRPLATLRIGLGVGIPLQLPGDDAGAAPEAATSKPTSLAERSAGGMLRSQPSGTQPSPTLPGRAVPEQPGDLDGPRP